VSRRLVDVLAEAFELHDPEEWGPGPLSDFIEERIPALRADQPDVVAVGGRLDGGMISTAVAGTNLCPDCGHPARHHGRGNGMNRAGGPRRGDTECIGRGESGGRCACTRPAWVPATRRPWQPSDAEDVEGEGA
jgi:hypothetical protein